MTTSPRPLLLTVLPDDDKSRSGLKSLGLAVHRVLLESNADPLVIAGDEHRLCFLAHAAPQSLHAALDAALRPDVRWLVAPLDSEPIAAGLNATDAWFRRHGLHPRRS